MREVLRNMKWLGHDGFVIPAGGRTIVVDPFSVTESVPADVLCITHGHYDHCSPGDAEKFLTPRTIIVTEPQAGAKFSGGVRLMKPGDTLSAAGVTISAVPAYNTDKAFHPKSNQWLGFVISAGGVRIYHAGDTDLIPEMEGLDVDIALLPVSGTYVMTWEQAVEAARKIRPKVAVPMHYGAIVGSRADAENFARALSGVCEVKIF